jgi:hypothetical protein
MTRRTGMVSGAAAAAMVLGFASPIWAQATNTPETGGQLNQCWGQVASGIAQLGRDDDMSGGGMGSHTRSTTAADNVGGFAASSNDGFTFNELNEEGNHGRDGVGNVSAGGFHNSHPGDGGNGQHAINNSNDSVNGFGLANDIDPVTGGPSAGDQGLGCDLVP